MKPVILITSCSYRLKENELCRETWLREWGHLIDYKFVMGFGCPVKHGDELIVAVDDGYYGLPDKIQVSHKWAWTEGYTHILKTDSDVYVHIPRLLASGFEQFPYSGNLYYPDFIMGAAYWLDRRATETMLHAPLPYRGAPGGDDVWVGHIMSESGIAAHDDKRYHIGENIPWDDVISLHVSGPPRLDMKEIHRRFTS
jgi:hypothetical protein